MAKIDRIAPAVSYEELRERRSRRLSRIIGCWLLSKATRRKLAAPVASVRVVKRGRKEVQVPYNIYPDLASRSCPRRTSPLPRQQHVRRMISRFAAHTQRDWMNGQLPVCGLFVMVGKAEQLPKAHKYRATVARILWRRRQQWLTAQRIDGLGFVSVVPLENLPLVALSESA